MLLVGLLRSAWQRPRSGKGVAPSRGLFFYAEPGNKVWSFWAIAQTDISLSLNPCGYPTSVPQCGPIIPISGGFIPLPSRISPFSSHFRAVLSHYPWPISRVHPTLMLTHPMTNTRPMTSPSSHLRGKISSNYSQLASWPASSLPVRG